MNSSGTISRRVMLQLLGISGLCSLLPSVVWAEAAGNSGAELFDFASAEIVAKEYLKLRPNEGRLEFLKKEISAALPELVGQSIEPGGLIAIAESIDRAVKQDFIDGNVIEVSGWILSRLELRLCALVSVSNAGR